MLQLWWRDVMARATTDADIALWLRTITSDECAAALVVALANAKVPAKQ